MTKYGSIQKNDAIFHYVMIEAGCLDNPGVRIKGGRISDGPLYVPFIHFYLFDISIKKFENKIY